MNATQEAITKAHLSGKCLQAELSADLDQLARQMRQALGDAHEAGYRQAASYHKGTQQAGEASTHAAQLAKVAEATMWQLFYKLAGEVKSSRTSCHCAERMGQL